jgi:hypothetical protein
LLGLSSGDDDEDERDKEEFENVDNIYVEYNLK